MAIELRHLRYVIAAADSGSFRRAAAALAIHESAISRRVRDLEDELGAALFIRHRCGVHLTYAGQQFLRTARQTIDQLGCATKHADTIGRGEEGVVRIGLISSLASGFLAELFQAFGASHPGVQLDFIEGGLSDHVPAIQQYQIDIAFLIGIPIVEGCDVAQLWNERVYVAMPAEHRLAEQDEIEWGDLCKQNFVVSETPPGPGIQDYLLRHLSQLGFRPSIERQAVYRDTLMQIVANGRGLTLISAAATAARFPGVVYRPLAGEVLPFSAIWSPRNDNPALRRLLSLARTMSKRSKADLGRTSTTIPPGTHP